MNLALWMVTFGKVIDGTTGKPAAGANVRRIPRVFNTQPFTLPVQQEGPVEIVLGSDHGVVEGRVVNERQDPAVNVNVAFVPDRVHNACRDSRETIVSRSPRSQEGCPRGSAEQSKVVPKLNLPKLLVRGRIALNFSGTPPDWRVYIPAN